MDGNQDRNPVRLELKPLSREERAARDKKLEESFKRTATYRLMKREADRHEKLMKMAMGPGFKWMKQHQRMIDRAGISQDPRGWQSGVTDAWAALAESPFRGIEFGGAGAAFSKALEEDRRSREALFGSSTVMADAAAQVTKGWESALGSSAMASVAEFAAAASIVPNLASPTFSGLEFFSPRFTPLLDGVFEQLAWVRDLPKLGGCHLSEVLPHLWRGGSPTREAPMLRGPVGPAEYPLREHRPRARSQRSDQRRNLQSALPAAVIPAEEVVEMLMERFGLTRDQALRVWFERDAVVDQSANFVNADATSGMALPEASGLGQRLHGRRSISLPGTTRENPTADGLATHGRIEIRENPTSKRFAEFEGFGRLHHPRAPIGSTVGLWLVLLAKRGRRELINGESCLVVTERDACALWEECARLGFIKMKCRDTETVEHRVTKLFHSFCGSALVREIGKSRFGSVRSGSEKKYFFKGELDLQVTAPRWAKDLELE